MIIATLAFLKMFGMTILQNASFTLVSRARNSSSIVYHATAAVFSNLLWLIVAAEAIKTDKTYLKVGYVLGAVVGSISMHYISMRYFEKANFNWKKLWADIVIFTQLLFTKLKTQIITSEVTERI
jgi:hypothetical protein